MAIMQFPGLIDAHVHLREPGYVQKEDFYSGSCAALAGGVVVMLDMPNTQPPTATPARLAEKAALAKGKVVCDVGLFVGATTDQVDAYLPVATQACGLKIYVSDTFGSLRIESLTLMHRFFQSWGDLGARLGYRSRGRAHGIGPIAVHAEELMLPVCLALSHLYDTPLHIVHVTRRSEIELIARAKERGYPVTCEVSPHHLLLTSEDAAQLGPYGDMRPRLASVDDVAAMWEHLAYVDLFATDHAPHTRSEKDGANPPPGVPGVETMLPLLLTEVQHGRLRYEDIVTRCFEAPRRIYGIKTSADTQVEVDVDAVYTLEDRAMRTRVGWTPFRGRQVFGRVERVRLRGQIVYEHGEVMAAPGTGHVLFGAAMER